MGGFFFFVKCPLRYKCLFICCLDPVYMYISDFISRRLHLFFFK
uniref:Uncharacterized protein n=1 Tax=Lepeophtheirus salmonis TaxID=72036 RepID=A0A0K2V2E0_LEPSM